MKMTPIVYDWASFTVTTGQTNYDVKANVAALFSNVPKAKHIVIFFNQQISIRFNNTLMPAAVMPISRSPFQAPADFLEIDNLYITNNSGSTVTVEIYLW